MNLDEKGILGIIILFSSFLSYLYHPAFCVFSLFAALDLIQSAFTDYYLVRAFFPK